MSQDPSSTPNNSIHINNGETTAYVTPQDSSYNSLVDAVKSIFGDLTKQPSERRLEANRQNCQKSTGPKTDAGKAKSRMNALKNEFTGEKLILRDDEFIHYFAQIARVVEDLRPVGAVEEQLAQQIAESHSRLNMLAAVQTNMLNLDTLDVMMDYPATADPHLIEVTGKVESLRNDCSGPKVFDTIGKQEARTTRHLIRLQEMFDKRQDRRMKRNKDVDTFELGNCRIHKLALTQLHYYEQLEQRARDAAEERANEAARRAAEDAAMKQQEEEAKEDALKAEAAQTEANTTTSALASFDKKPDVPTPAVIQQAAPAPKTAVPSRKSRRKGGKKSRR